MFIIYFSLYSVNVQCEVFAVTMILVPRWVSSAMKMIRLWRDRSVTMNQTGLTQMATLNSL